MDVCVCVCVYVCMDVYVGLCVCSWIGGQGGDLISRIFKAPPECPEDLSLSIFFSLSILVRRPHKERCLRKPARLEERAKDVSQSGAEKQLGVRPIV